VILVDAGPLVALLDADDRRHAECADVLAALREPMLTVWPAFTEAMHILRFSASVQDALWQMLETDVLWMAELNDEDCGRARYLMKKYRDLPMDLADALLMRVAERERIRRIFTVDRRDFSVYRPHGIGRFEILP
jgi:predicted nucleic acid-binding protein